MADLKSESLKAIAFDVSLNWGFIGLGAPYCLESILRPRVFENSHEWDYLQLWPDTNRGKEKKQHKPPNFHGPICWNVLEALPPYTKS